MSCEWREGGIAIVSCTTQEREREREREREERKRTTRASDKYDHKTRQTHHMHRRPSTTNNSCPGYEVTDIHNVVSRFAGCQDYFTTITTRGVELVKTETLRVPR